MINFQSHNMEKDPSGYYKVSQIDVTYAERLSKEIREMRSSLLSLLGFPVSYVELGIKNQYDLCQNYSFICQYNNDINRDEAFAYYMVDFSKRIMNDNLPESFEYFIRNAENSGSNLPLLKSVYFSKKNIERMIRFWEYSDNLILSDEQLKSDPSYNLKRKRTYPEQPEILLSQANFYFGQFETKPVNSPDTPSDVSAKSANYESTLKEYKQKYYSKYINNMEKEAELFNKDFLFKETSFNNTSMKMKSMYDAYVGVVNKYKLTDSRSASMIKTAVYAYLYANRSKNSEPYTYMNNIVNAKKRWTGSRNEFYTDSDMSKAFFALYSYHDNELHPYADILRNSEADVINYNARKIHNWFALNGVDEHMYQVFYGDSGRDGVYTILSRVKELVDVFNDPIVVDPNALGISSMFTGIVSSITNSAWNIIDSSLDSSANAAFNTKFIPFSNENLSIASLYNKAYFLRTILANGVNVDDVIDEITKEQLISGALTATGEDIESFEYNGWGTMSKNLGKVQNVDLELDWIAEENSQMFHSAVMFAIQKIKYLNGHRDDANLADIGVNLSDFFSVSNLLSSLTATEGYFISKHYLADTSKIPAFSSYEDDGFKKFTSGLIKGGMSIYNHDSATFYKEYLLRRGESDYTNEITNDGYSHYSLNRYLVQCSYEYFDNLEKNRDMIADEVFNSFDLGSTGDFMLRFIPSIKIILNMLGVGTDITGGKIIGLLDSLLAFIDTNLYEGLYLSVKDMLKNEVVNMTRSAFAAAQGSSSDVIKVGTGLNLDSLSSALNDSMLLLDRMILDVKDMNLYTYKNLRVPREYNGEFSPDEPLYKGPDIVVEYDYPEYDDPKYDNVKDTEDKLGDLYDKVVVDKDGNILGKDENGTLYPINPGDIPELDKIKDKIDEVVNEEIVNNRNKISNLEKEILDELKNKRPDFSQIKHWKEQIETLEKEINDIKNKNKMEVSIGSNSYSHLPDDTIGETELVIADLSSKNDLLLNSIILDEASRFAFSNKIPLSNSELLALLQKNK